MRACGYVRACRCVRAGLCVRACVGGWVGGRVCVCVCVCFPARERVCVCAYCAAGKYLKPFIEKPAE